MAEEIDEGDGPQLEVMATDDFNEYGLGRMPSPFDSRDALHPMRAVLMLTATPQPPFKYWPSGPVLNQGATPQCVGFAWAQWMQTSPTRHSGAAEHFDGNAKGHEIYAACKTFDGIPDMDGTYVRSGVQQMKNEDRVVRYLWAGSLNDLIDWVLRVGPVVVGTDWHQSMFVPREDGSLVANGTVVGGHAYLIRGYSRKRGQFRMVNSWGEGWGQGGQAWLDEALLWALVSTGEAVAAIEQKPA